MSNSFRTRALLGAARLAADRPRRVVAVAGAAALAAGLLAATRLRVGGDLLELLPDRPGPSRAFGRYLRRFGAEQTLTGIVEHDDPAAAAALADALAAELGRSPLVAEVVRRAPAADLGLDDPATAALLLDDEGRRALASRLEPAALAARARRLRTLLASPLSTALARRLTEDPLEVRPLAGRLLGGAAAAVNARGELASADGRAALILARLRRPPQDLAFDRALEVALAGAERAARARLGAPAARGGPTVGWTGAHRYWVAMAGRVQRDLAVSSLLSLVGVGVIFLVAFRRLRLAPLLAAALAAGGLYALGGAALVGGMVGTVSLGFGAVGIGLGIDAATHLWHRIAEELGARSPRDADGPAVRAAFERAFVGNGGAILASTLTTVAALLTFTRSSFAGLRDLGVLSAIALAAAQPAMLLLFPALLRLFGPRPAPPDALEAGLGRLGAAIARRPRAVLVVAGLITLGAVAIARDLPIERRLLRYQPEDLPPARAERALRARLGVDADRLIFVVEGRDREEALERGERVAAAARALVARGVLARVEALDALAPAARTLARRRAALAALDPPAAARAFGVALDGLGVRGDALAPAVARLAEGPAPPAARLERGALAFLARRHLSSTPGGGAAVALYAYPAPGRDAATLERALAGLAAAGGGPVELTGALLVEAELGATLRADLRRLAAWATAVVAALLLVHLRSPRQVLCVLVPLGAVAAATLAALRLVGAPLTLFNLVSIPLLIGIGVDDHLYVLERYLEGGRRDLAGALRGAGRPVVLTSLTTMAGFGALAASTLPGLRGLGLAVALAIGLALFAALGVMPALLAVLDPPRR